VLTRDLEAVYRAGLPSEEGVSTAWPAQLDAWIEPFSATSPWESPALQHLRHARDAFFVGEPVEAVPGPEFISLALHAWARWLGHKDAVRARAVATSLSELSPTIAAKLLGYADLLEAEAASARGDLRVAYRVASHAQQRLRAVGSTASDADLSSRYLDAQISLSQLTNGWNLEYAVYQARRFLTRAIRDLGHVPCLYLLLSLAAALAGRSEDAVDELGRAVYYAQGDAFYARLAVDDDYVARLRPVLVAQCREALIRAAEQPLAHRDRVS
jgi:hypothetical protein